MPGRGQLRRAASSVRSALRKTTRVFAVAALPRSRQRRAGSSLEAAAPSAGGRRAVRVAAARRPRTAEAPATRRRRGGDLLLATRGVFAVHRHRHPAGAGAGPAAEGGRGGGLAMVAYVPRWGAARRAPGQALPFPPRWRPGQARRRATRQRQELAQEEGTSVARRETSRESFGPGGVGVGHRVSSAPSPPTRSASTLPAQP